MSKHETDKIKQLEARVRFLEDALLWLMSHEVKCWGTAELAKLKELVKNRRGD